MLAPVSLRDNLSLAFVNQSTSVSASGLSVSFTFKTNRAALVYYRLVINVNEVSRQVV